MLSRIKSKLNSRRGASIVLALFLLLICAFAGTAALTAGSSNVGRYSYICDYQQQYFAVSSAARLIHDELKNGNSELTKLISDCIDGSSGEYISLDLTVADSSSDELDNLNVTVLLLSYKGKIDVIVQSNEDGEYGEYALRFSMKISGNSASEISDIEQTFKREGIS